LNIKDSEKCSPLHIAGRFGRSDIVARLLETEGVDFNTKALQNLLSGQKNAYRDIVLLNAAAALIIAGRAENLPQGVAIAAEIIDNGQAQAYLTGLIQTTTGNIA
jgi:anthranilate phosphoribosyltransferase